MTFHALWNKLRVRGKTTTGFNHKHEPKRGEREVAKSKREGPPGTTGGKLLSGGDDITRHPFRVTRTGGRSLRLRQDSFDRTEEESNASCSSRRGFTFFVSPACRASGNDKVHN